MPCPSRAELEGPHPLQIVSPSLPVELPAPPDHLSPAMQLWWRVIVSDFELGAHHLKLLEAAADAWDRLATARAELLRDGLTIPTGTGSRKPHPCIAVERDSRASFARLIRELDLDEPVPPPARYMPPPSLRSNRRR